MKPLTRIGAFLGLWAIHLTRQPLLVLLLVIGPFAILFLFGQGVEIGGPRPRTLLVRTGEPGPAEPLPSDLERHIILVGESPSAEAARAELLAGHVDAVAVVPRDPLSYVARGEHVPIEVTTQEIDPVRESYARAFLNDLVASVNRSTIEKTVAEAQVSLREVQPTLDRAQTLLQTAQATGVAGELASLRSSLVGVEDVASRARDVARAGSALVSPLADLATRADALAASARRARAGLGVLDQDTGPNATRLSPDEIASLQEQISDVNMIVDRVVSTSPEVLSAPFKLTREDLAAERRNFSTFYAPAVLALLAQHLAISLTALSMTRQRLLGVTDLLRVAPVRPFEVTVGQYLSYGGLVLLSTFALLGLMLGIMGVPVLGPWTAVVGLLLLLILASLGVGFAFSLVARSEQQAAQLAMLVLLASIFLGGFAFSLDRIVWPVRAISYVLPATYGIRSLQDLLLRGVLPHPSDLAVLGGAAAVLFVLTAWLLARELRPK